MTKPLKIVLLGDPGTGKTNLWSRVTKHYFNPEYEPSTAMLASSYTIHIGSQTVEADLWDFAGGENYRCLINSRLGDADGILLVYDKSNPTTFGNLAKWLSHIRETACPKTVIKLVGNKNDLQSRVPRKEAEKFATDNGLSYIETSALNDNNVHLAFESIAQEINVTMHSVPEYFVPKEKASSKHDDGIPFQVVLIDIEQAALHETIVCIEKPLDEANLEFIAISYRWGEVEEQVLDTKLGYMASITSFGLNDFYKLCRDMMKEADLRGIKYVWVDTICVDQNNQVHRKATIYQMSNIYHRAAYIVAVPDLHLEYLMANGIFDFEHSGNAYKLNELAYYLLHGKLDQVGHVTEKWFDEVGIPKDARKNLTKPFQKRFMDYLDVYHLQDADSLCHDGCEHNCYHSDSMNCHDTPKTMLDHLQYAINECHDHPENTTMVVENSDCTLCSLQMDMCQHQKRLNKVIPDAADQPWLASVLKEFHYEKLRSLVDKQSQAVAKLMHYLAYLIRDWSSRVWVISEYNIAKTKPSRKMKFWFLSLGIDWQDVESLDFFAFDFNKQEKNELTESDVSLDCVAYEANVSYLHFQNTWMFQLNRQSFLEIMLNSKASRNEDRFYAIFPSTEYKNKLTSRDVVSSWKIDNIASVKLRLYDLMTIKDKLELLYLTAWSSSTSACTFPAFVNIHVDRWTAPPVEERNKKNWPCNFDLNDNASVQMLLPDMPLDNENQNHFYQLNLSPKMYYVISDGTAYVKERFDELFNENKGLWEILEVSYENDDMVFVYIPLYTHDIDRKKITNETEYITLFGSFKKSKWLLCKNNFRYSFRKVINNFSWECYDNSDKHTSFDVY